jgi:hypothetical protein
LVRLRFLPDPNREPEERSLIESLRPNDRLAYTAFHKVFSCKPTLFRKTDLVRRLAEEVSRTGMVDRVAGTMRAEEPLDLGVVWGGVIEEGWKGMAKVRF